MSVVHAVVALARHMLVGQERVEVGLLRGLRQILNDDRVASDLGLREDGP
ncbi:MAG: hypothetical protein GY910_13680 [bacterium]|nr:hypothetical protein [bacterium]